MCKEYRWVISTASVSGMIQSLAWLAFGISGALVYLCLIPVNQYETSEDFFRVTLVKLYFEGPKGRLNGSYLGRFDEDRRTEVDLFSQDLVFALMVAYVILNVVYFISSVTFYKYRKANNKRGVALRWSLLSLVICAVDALFTYVLVLDILTLKDYLSRETESVNRLPAEVSQLPYIPLTLALVSSRFIAGWLWNFIFGLVIFLDALCCRNIIRKKKVNAVQVPAPPPVEKKEKPEPAVSLINGTEKREFDVSFNRDKWSLDLKDSMEATTRFNIPEKPPSTKESSEKDWSFNRHENYWKPKHRSSKEWGALNEGFESDEAEMAEAETKKRPDFDHDVRNFEAGQRKIKIVKPPLGKPVETVESVNRSGGERSLETHS